MLDTVPFLLSQNGSSLQPSPLRFGVRNLMLSNQAIHCETNNQILLRDAGPSEITFDWRAHMLINMSSGFRLTTTTRTTIRPLAEIMTATTTTTTTTTTQPAGIPMELLLVGIEVPVVIVVIVVI